MGGTGLAIGPTVARTAYCSPMESANDVIKSVVGLAWRTGRKASSSCSTEATTTTSTVTTRITSAGWSRR